MKTTVSLALAAAIAAGGVAVAAPAQAYKVDRTTLGCVTKTEFKRAKKGLWKFEVKEIFGTGGKQTSYYKGYTFRMESREYRVCGSSYSSVMVTFEDGELRTKYGFWM